MGEDFILPYVPWFVAGGMTLGLVSIVSWVFVTWLRIKHGYPLETSWGKPLEPRATAETAERFKLIASENAQLRAELGSMKDRLATVERIVTDDSQRLTQEIESLRTSRN
jgi:hypothetical protein